MIGETIKWRINIVNLTNGICFGIGLKKVLKNNGFAFKSNYDKHGCYIVRENGNAYTYMDK